MLSHLGEFFRDSWNQQSDVFLVKEVCKGAYELQIGRRGKQIESRVRLLGAAYLHAQL